MHRWLVSAAHKSSGKTMFSIGLAAALRERGLGVQPYKKGPDYIDPMWLSAAAGRDCRNLDHFLGGEAEVRRVFERHLGGARVALVEGNKGLHDGVSLDGSDSSAALARALGLEVILVLDARGMTRGIAPLLIGLRSFDPDLRIAGVVLNRVAGSRHESKLRAAIERYTDVEVLGTLAEDADGFVAERHLGLIPFNESLAAGQRIGRLAQAVRAGVDLERLLARPQVAPANPSAVSVQPLGPLEPLERREPLEPREPLQRPLPASPRTLSPLPVPPRAAALRIGIARDRAFGFYYPDDLDALRAAGATLVPFDTLADANLPRVDALFIGGGFPEMLAAELEANAGMRDAIRAAIEGGMPVYAECGGLMYLARSIELEGRSYRMVGALAADVRMHRKPVGRGYVRLQPTAEHPWFGTGVSRAMEIRGHEFHYSSLENIGDGLRFGYRVLRGHGVDGERDGLVWRNAFASYAHLRCVAGNDWARRFVAFASAHARRAPLDEKVHRATLQAAGAR